MACVYLKRGTWYAQVKDVTGKRRQIALTATTKTEARRLALELERKVERQKLGLEAVQRDATLTVGELCEWWLAAKCPEASRASDRSRLGKHVIATELGALPLSRVTPAAIEARLDAMAASGASPASVNHVRRKLHTIFRRATKAEKWAGPNPVDLTEPLPVPRRSYLTLSADEVRRLLSSSRPPWRWIFAAGLYTGMRKGELFALRKDHVHLEDEEIIVAASWARDTTKGGHADALPIAPQLRPHLEAALVAAGRSDLLFPAPPDERRKGPGDMRSRHTKTEGYLRRALARAGIVVGYDHVCRRCKGQGKAHVERHPDAAPRTCPACGMKLWPRAVPRPLRFHDLRHSTATLLFRAGVDAHHVQRVLRHASLDTTTGTYAHLIVDDLRDAVASLPAAPTGGLPAAAGRTSRLPGSAGTSPLPTRCLPAESGKAKPPNPAAENRVDSGASVARDTGFEPVAFGSGGQPERASTGSHASQDRVNRGDSRCPGAAVQRAVSHPIASDPEILPTRGLPDPGPALAKGYGSEDPGGLTVREAAEALGVSTATVYGLVKRGRLPATRDSAHAIRIRPEDLASHAAARGRR